MTNASRRFLLCGALLSIGLSANAIAAAQDAPTAFQKQLAKIDLGVAGVGMFTPNNSGTTYLPQIVSQVPSSTLGAIIELRYIKSPLVGLEYNYGYARYTDNFTLQNTTGTPGGAAQYAIGIQTKVTEYTLGYVAHAHTFLGLDPFAAAGAGAITFRPTAFGGLSVPPVFRSAFYYSVGVESLVYGNHFGLRAQFRQVFFGAPDFNQNYLATGVRSITTEPGVGFFLRF